VTYSAALANPTGYPQKNRTLPKSHLATGQRSRRSAGKLAPAKGTVAALKPSALTVPENITVAEASQLGAAKRTDCVDDDEGLSGIFTVKDLAYRLRIRLPITEFV